MTLDQFLDRVRARLVKSLEPDSARIVLSVTDPELFTRKPVADLVTLRGANVATPLKTQSTRVSSLIVAAGPRADGTTANAAPLFIGQEGVTGLFGFPIQPGETLAMGPVDLASVFFVGTNAADVLRIFYQVA